MRNSEIGNDLIRGFYAVAQNGQKKKKKNEEKTKKNDLKIPLMIKIIKILLKRESLVLSATCHLGGGGNYVILLIYILIENYLK